MYKLALLYFDFGMDLIIFQDDLTIAASYNYKSKTNCRRTDFKNQIQQQELIGIAPSDGIIKPCHFDKFKPG